MIKEFYNEINSFFCFLIYLVFLPAVIFLLLLFFKGARRGEGMRQQLSVRNVLFSGGKMEKIEFFLLQC
jgi:hypothetical protein